MLSIGFFEILIIAVLGLMVFGPEKLPEAIRTFAIGFSKVKRSWNNTRRELEQELGMDDIRREIHNAQVMEDLERLKEKTKKSVEDITKDVEESIAMSKDAASGGSPENEGQGDIIESEHLASDTTHADKNSNPTDNA